MAEPTSDRSAGHFAWILRRVVWACPDARTIHFVMDYLNTHCEKSPVDHPGRQVGRALWRRLQVRYTPKHGRWLNQAELELCLFTRQCLGTRPIGDLASLQRETRAWNTRANRTGTRINWRFTRRNARRKCGYQQNLSGRSRT